MKRILLIRLSALGDVVMASSLIPAVRRTWPDAFLAWLVEPLASELLSGNPRIDRVIVWPKQEWKQLWLERRYKQLFQRIRQFRQELKRYDFDLVLDAHGLLKSGFLSRLSAAPERIGLGSREGSSLFMTKVVPLPPRDNPRLGSEYLHFAAAAGLGENPAPMDIEVAQEAVNAGRTKVQGLGIAGAYAVFCPFTTRPQKHWPQQSWLELAGSVIDKLDCPMIMLGGPQDLPAAQSLMRHNIPRLYSLAGQTSIAEAAAVIKSAQWLAGVDTGMTHLGVALDVPTVAIFGSTVPYLDTGSAKAKVLYRAMSCSPCRRRPSCNGAFTCMKQYSAGDVLAAVKSML